MTNATVTLSKAEIVTKQHLGGIWASIWGALSKAEIITKLHLGSIWRLKSPRINTDRLQVVLGPSGRIWSNFGATGTLGTPMSTRKNGERNFPRAGPQSVLKATTQRVLKTGSAKYGGEPNRPQNVGAGSAGMGGA